MAEKANIRTGYRTDEKQAMRHTVARELRPEHLLENVEGQIVIIDDCTDGTIAAPHDVNEVEVEQLIAIDRRMTLRPVGEDEVVGPVRNAGILHAAKAFVEAVDLRAVQDLDIGPHIRSEEHTSELQSLMSNSYAVFCLKQK